jgi:hypothetical protein
MMAVPKLGCMLRYVMGEAAPHPKPLKTGADTSRLQTSPGRAEFFALPEEGLKLPQLGQCLAGVDQLSCKL